MDTFKRTGWRMIVNDLVSLKSKRL